MGTSSSVKAVKGLKSLLSVRGDELAIGHTDFLLGPRLRRSQQVLQLCGARQLRAE